MHWNVHCVDNSGWAILRRRHAQVIVKVQTHIATASQDHTNTVVVAQCKVTLQMT